VAGCRWVVRVDHRWVLDPGGCEMTASPCVLVAALRRAVPSSERTALASYVCGCDPSGFLVAILVDWVAKDAK